MPSSVYVIAPPPCNTHASCGSSRSGTREHHRRSSGVALRTITGFQRRRLSAFPSMASDVKKGETVLTGPLQDRSAVFAALGQIEALGLELLESRQIPARRSSPAAGTYRSPLSL